MMIRTPRSIAAHRTCVWWWGASEHLLDGLPPAAIIAPAKGVYQLGGAYVPVGDVLTVSSGTKHVIGPSGLIETVALNTPAIDWSDGRPRLLIEAAAATNYQSFGQSPGSDGWTLRGTAAVVTGIPDPTGGASAVQVTIGDAGNDIYRGILGGGASSRHEPSVFIRRVSTTGTLLMRNPANFDLGLWTVDLALLPDGWVRLTRSHAAVTVVVEFTTDATNSCGLLFASATSPVTFEVWAAQVEKGFASTSPILTTGDAAVTRIADDLRLTASALAQVTGADGCTIVLRGSIPGPGGYIICGAVNGVILASYSMYRSDGATAHWFVATLDGTTFGLAFTAGGGGRKVSINGSATSAAAISSLLDLTDETSIRIGARLDGAGALSRLFVDQILVYPFVGSDAGLQAQAHAYGA